MFLPFVFYFLRFVAICSGPIGKESDHVCTPLLEVFSNGRYQLIGEVFLMGGVPLLRAVP